MGRSLDRIGASRTGTINPPRAQLYRGYGDYCYRGRGGKESRTAAALSDAHGRGDYPHKYIQDPLYEPEDVDNVIMRAWANEDAR